MCVNTLSVSVDLISEPVTAVLPESLTNCVVFRVVCAVLQIQRKKQDIKLFPCVLTFKKCWFVVALLV